MVSLSINDANEIKKIFIDAVKKGLEPYLEFTERYVCYGLSELHDIIHQKHPKAKIFSIFGGPA